MQADTLLYPLKVRFIGESGVDAGGLVSELYTAFFTQLPVSRPDLLESVDADDAPISGFTCLPKRDAADLDALRAVGRVLLKSVLDRRPVPSTFAPSLFKHLLGLEPNLRDLELFNRTLALTLRGLLVQSVSSLELHFEGGRNGEEGPRVTDSNKMQYVQARTHDLLVGSREAQLVAVREGFQHVDLAAYLQVFNCTDLMLLVCGEDHIDAHIVSNLLVFEGWPEDSPTPGHLRALLGEMQPNDLRRFLRLATSQCTVPRTSVASASAVTVQHCPQSERLPIGRTCFRRLDVPDYRDMDVLKTKLQLALATLDTSGFGLR